MTCSIFPQSLNSGRRRSQRSIPGEWRESNENFRLSRRDEGGQCRRLKQRIEDGDDSGRFAAPDGEMAFGKIGKNDSHDIVLANSEPVEGVGRLGDPAENSA